MNRPSGNAGFTFIELIVVISIIALVLLFSFPALNRIDLFSSPGGTIGDISRLADDLKARATEKNLDHFLHLDPVSGDLWVTHDNMDEDEAEAAKANAVEISDTVSIAGFEYPVTRMTDDSAYRIRFSKNGYSDFVYIRFMDDDSPVTLMIEPFIPKTRIINKHVYFEDCI